MAASDSLHVALDLHQLDPKAKEDRPYLISLLRRMGYSEVEIADVVSGARTLQQVDQARTAPETSVQAPAPVADGASGPRIIELEYGGAGHLPEFEPVVPKSRVANTVQRSSGPVAPETVFEVQELAEPEPEPEETEFVIIDPEHVREVRFQDLDDEGLVTFEDLDAAQEDWDEWHPDDDPSIPARPAPVAGHRHGDFLLYRRELDDGQHVYFFSRKAPSDAEPAAIPSGYAVAEASDTGLPYLAPE